MSFTLRPATETDRELLFDLLRRALGPHLARAHGAWDEEEQRARWDELTSPAAHEVVEIDGRAVGCTSVRVTDEEIRVNRIFLFPEHQGRGLGTKLLHRILHLADERRLPVRLRVLHGNPARRLWERAGFRVTGETATHLWMERSPDSGGGVSTEAIVTR